MLYTHSRTNQFTSYTFNPNTFYLVFYDNMQLSYYKIIISFKYSRIQCMYCLDNIDYWFTCYLLINKRKQL